MDKPFENDPHHSNIYNSNYISGQGEMDSSNACFKQKEKLNQDPYPKEEGNNIFTQMRRIIHWEIVLMNSPLRIMLKTPKV